MPSVPPPALLIEGDQIVSYPFSNKSPVQALPIGKSGVVLLGG